MGIYVTLDHDIVHYQRIAVLMYIDVMNTNHPPVLYPLQDYSL